MPPRIHTVWQRRFLITSHVLTAFFAACYLAMAVLAYRKSTDLLWRFLLFSAIPVLVVTLLRLLIAAPRPSTAGRKSTKKNSFPSRHAFSAFFVAMLAFFFGARFSYILLAFAIFLSVSRVLSGKHYPRDVVAGAALGVILGTVILVLL